MQLLIVIFMCLSLITCDFNNSTNKNKCIISNTTNYNNRPNRCINLLPNLKRVNTLKSSLFNFQNVGTKNVNVSKCRKDNVGDFTFVNEHILDGLLLDDNLPDSHWIDFKSLHGKKYITSVFEEAALAEWRKNLRRVAKHNRNFLAGKQTYSLHLNMLGDLGSADYFKKMLKLIDTAPLFDPAEDHRRATYRRNYYKRTPKEIDWRKKGYKPRLEEQYKCGACYAFAVTHAVQAQLYRKHKDWRELSPQQIVDCSFKDGNQGCDGGSLRAAIRYAARDGLVMERNYPYRGKKGFCRSTLLYPRVRVQRWATLPTGDERAIEKALATIGPLAVAVNAAPFTFQLYRSGIYDDPFCTPWQLNHAMLLVGYTPQYWVLMNWWGTDWGEGGYIRIKRGFNRCGVANMAAYVEI